MKKLLCAMFFVSCLTGTAQVRCESSNQDQDPVDCLVVQGDEDNQKQLYIAKKAIHIEEKITFFEDKIEELEEKAESYQAFKESFAIGMLGALSVLCSGDMRVGPVFIVAILSGLNRVRSRTELHITSQLIGSALGAQWLLFFAGGW